MSTRFILRALVVSALIPAFSYADEASDLRFASALKVVQDSCMRCHGVDSDKGGFASFTTEDQFKTAKDADGQPIVVAASLENSQLFQRLIGSGNPNADMPKRRPPLTEAEIQTIREWILGLAP